MPSACAATPGLERSSTFIAMRNPSPSLPSRFAAETTTSSRCNSAVLLPRMPSLPWMVVALNPLRCCASSSTNALTPFARAVGSVFANRTMVSAIPPSEIQILLPVMT